MKSFSKLFFLACFSFFMASGLSAQNARESTKQVLKAECAQSVKQYVKDGQIISLKLTGEGMREQFAQIKYLPDGSIEMVNLDRNPNRGGKADHNFIIDYDATKQSVAIKTKAGVNIVDYSVSPKAGKKNEIGCN